MKFSINSLVLWPKNEEFSYRRLPFVDGKINIITGASRTGKSAIIPIIDYCLCSGKCSIPVDIIRDSCAWFGVLFDLENEQLLLCRKEPGEHASTNEMYEYSRKVDGRSKIQGRLCGKFEGKAKEAAACPILRRKTSMDGMTLKPPLWQVLKPGAE